MELWLEIENNDREYKDAVLNIESLRTAFTQAKADYNMARAKKELELDASGKAKSLIPDYAKGDAHICALAMKMDIAEGACDQNKEYINYLKRHQDLLVMQYKIEMGVS